MKQWITIEAMETRMRESELAVKTLDILIKKTIYFRVDVEHDRGSVTSLSHQHPTTLCLQNCDEILKLSAV